MILWFVLTAMIAIATLFVAAPFIRRTDRRLLESASDIAVFRDQLAEVDYEASLGLIDSAQAELARTEIKRRLLAVREAEGSALPPLANGERSFTAIGVASVVVFGSVALYALTGKFEQVTDTQSAVQDPASTKPGTKTAGARETALSPMLATASGENTSPKIPRAREPLPPVEEMIQRLVTRLQGNPKDVEGWRMLGWSYVNTKHYTEAAAAYAKAIEINPDSVDLRDSHVDSLIHAAKGVVTLQAKEANEETLKGHPKDSRARFIRGLAIEQSGDKEAALKAWNELLGELDNNDPYAQEIRQRIARGGKELDAESAQPTTPGVATTPAVAANIEVSVPFAPTGEKGPRPEDIRDAEAMTPAERQAMIRRMVDSLENRLEQSPSDADGWIKLIRSHSTLGDRDRAKSAFEKASKAFPTESGEHKRIKATAEELGLNK